MNTLALAALLTPLLLSACAGSTPGAEDPHAEHAEHARLAGATHAFHETLAPLWHASKGPEREAHTCDAIPAFEKGAADVLGERPAGATGDGAGTTPAQASGQALVDAVAGLKVECAKAAGARADFDARFAAVHEAFHRVAEHH